VAVPGGVTSHVWLGGLGGRIGDTYHSRQRVPELIELLPKDFVVAEATVFPDDDHIR
jgi:hypothetical protein